MRGFDTLDLLAGDYRITPSEAMRDWDERVGALLSGEWGSLEDLEEFHKFTIEGTAGRPVLEVVQSREDDEIEFGVSLPVVRDVFRFRPPDGDPVFTLRSPSVRGWRRPYALENPADGGAVATVRKSGIVSRNWRLAEPDGTVRATADRDRSLRNLVSLSRLGEYVVSTPDGDGIARLELSRPGGSVADWALYEMTVSCTRVPFPTEILLAFAFVVLREAKESSGGTGTTRGR